MIPILGVVIFAMIVLIYRVVISGITKYNKVKAEFTKTHYEYTEKRSENNNQVIEMIEKDGVWKAVSNIRG